MDRKLLIVDNLVIHYETDNGIVEAVNNISFKIEHGETMGLVGETGAGKTTTALGIMRLIPDPQGRMIQGNIFLEGENLVKKSEAEMRKVRGQKISMIFQDPMTSLNPIMTVRDQVEEVIRLHNKLSRVDASLKTQEILELVGIPSERHSEYPHQFSGGMKQRVVIAIALACNPVLIIADEPTTALDVTIQAQILDLMKKLKEDLNTSILLITHDFGVVAETCDKVAIMYAGEIVEHGTLAQIFKSSKHPYTKGLFNSLPRLDKNVERLVPIKGLMPDPTNLPSGCSFYNRCDKRFEKCGKIDPAVVEIEPGHLVKCNLYEKGVQPNE